MAAEEGASGLSSSFTDLMTSLAVIFILLLVALSNNRQEELKEQKIKYEDLQRILKEKEEKSRDLRKELLTALKLEMRELAERGVEVREDVKDPLGLLVVVPEGLLNFGHGQSEIPDAGTAFLDVFIPRLARSACAYRKELNSIVVEGHTSSAGPEELNLQLSQERSFAVVRHSLATLAASEGQEQECFLDLLSASGRGERDLFYRDGVEDEAKSRRVVFKLRVRSFEQRNLEIGTTAPAPTDAASDPSPLINGAAGEARGGSAPANREIPPALRADPLLQRGSAVESARITNESPAPEDEFFVAVPNADFSDVIDPREQGADAR